MSFQVCRRAHTAATTDAATIQRCRAHASLSASIFHGREHLRCTSFNVFLTSGLSSGAGRCRPRQAFKNRLSVKEGQLRSPLRNKVQRLRPLPAFPLDDLPLAILLGAGVLYSAAPLVVPLERTEKEKADTQDSSIFGKGNVRFASMGIISFIPLFNWMAWLFAWLDTSEPQYLAFTAIYLAPYLKSGFSLDPEDSWLPLASVLICIAHVQIDSLARSGSPPEPLLKDSLPKLKLPEVSSPEFFESLKREQGEKSKAQGKDSEDSKVQDGGQEEENKAGEDEMRLWDEKFAKSMDEDKLPPKKKDP